MKTFTSILIVILFTFSNSYPQNFWVKTAGPDTSPTNALAVNSNDDVFAATTDGIFRSADDGGNWLNLGINQSIRLVFIGPNEDVLITTSEQGPIYRSIDNGTYWTPIGCTSWQTSLAINSDGDIFTGTATHGVYRTKDDGVHWVQIIQGLTDTHITSLLINSNQDIFAGTMFEGVFRSTDNGDSWVQINQGISRNYILSLGINPNGDIFAGTSNSGIFRSTDNGESWTQINQGLTYTQGYYIFSIVINSDGEIFLGTADGVFHSTDNGENWQQINEGLTNTGILSLAINSNKDIFAGTTSGVFLRLNNTTSVNTTETEIISSFALYQNYPNPFNPVTVIGYVVPASLNPSQGGTFISLKVYDILGKEAAVLVEEFKPAGFYEVEFNAAELPTGVYIYRIKTSNYVETKKMTLIR